MKITTIFDEDEDYDSGTDPPSCYTENVQMIHTKNIITDVDLMINLSSIHDSTDPFMDFTQKNDQKKINLKIKSSIQHPKKIQLKIKSSTQVPYDTQKLSIKIKPNNVPQTFPRNPPDQESHIFRTIKCPLKKVLQHYSLIQPVIEQYVLQANPMVALGYEFTKCYILDLYEKELPFPVLDRDFFTDVLKTISVKTDKRGRPSSEETQKSRQSFSCFYEQIFVKTMHEVRSSYSHMNHLITELANQMSTTLTTNLKTNFVKYLFKYLNIIHYKPRAKVIKQEKDVEKRKLLYRQLKRDLSTLKDALIHGDLNRTIPEYQSWFRQNRVLLFPSVFEKNIAYDVKCKPLNYLKHAIYINRQIEDLGFRPNQIFPQRSNGVPRSILLNSSSVMEMISAKLDHLFDQIPFKPRKIKRKNTPKEIPEYASVSELMNHADSYHTEIWSRILKLDNCFKKTDIFNQEPYQFYHQIRTDGFSCCLLFIHKDHVNRPHGQKKIENTEENVTDGVDNEPHEFWRLTDLSQDQRTQLLKGKYRMASNDPGESDPLSMFSNAPDTKNPYEEKEEIKKTKQRFFQYSAQRRRHETYTKRSSEILNIEKHKRGICELESPLSMTNPKKKKKKKKKKKENKTITEEVKSEEKGNLVSGRTTHIERFKHFIDLKHGISVNVHLFYEQMLFRKLGFRRYVRRLQSEARLVEEIRHKYLSEEDLQKGYQLVIFYGNHSRSQMMKGCIPCPGLGLKRLLSQYFLVLETDEYCTSIIHHKRQRRMTNLRVRRGQHNRKVHKILTLQEDTKQRIYVNRDYNASRNILNIGWYYLENHDKPLVFRRNQKTDDSLKVVNESSTGREENGATNLS